MIDCNFCGETLSAANDDELVEAVRQHMDDRHSDEGLDDAQVRKLVDEQAYDATDS